MFPTALIFIVSLYILGDGAAQVSRSDSLFGTSWGIVQLGVGAFMLINCAITWSLRIRRRRSGK